MDTPKYLFAKLFQKYPNFKVSEIVMDTYMWSIYSYYFSVSIFSYIKVSNMDTLMLGYSKVNDRYFKLQLLMDALTLEYPLGYLNFLIVRF